MKSRDVSNPLIRFRDVAISYDEGLGPPPAKVTLLEDHSRTILSRNDSPDLGFSWSANPYRGCLHACAYCLDPDTPVLMADARTRRIADLAVGDEIIGTVLRGRYRCYTRTRVLAHWQTRKPAFRLSLSDGTQLVASGDHRFLTDRGWKYVQPAEERPHLGLEDHLLGVPTWATAPVDGDGPVIDPRGLKVVSIEAVGEREMFDISTGTEDFVANGVISHNCYARPTHEYLDLGAGTDFDTKIVVKRDAPELLRAAFDKPSWQGELIMFSGVTDCYQAIEKDLEITRRCLEVCLEYRNPVSVISKSALVERDIELFQELAMDARFHIAVSLAFSDNEMSRAIEPWAASPDRRLKVIEKLAAAGLRPSVMIAPVIPGVNDSQMVTVLERAAAAGAVAAGWTLLRLPHSVKDVFEERIRTAMPLAADKILHRTRETRGGEKLYDPRFHTRGRGTGPYAETLATMFDATVARLGFDRRDDSWYDDKATFRRPPPRTGQLSLF